MINYVGLMLLLVSSACHGMQFAESEESSSIAGKRGFDKNSLQSASEADQPRVKQSRVKKQKSVQKANFFVIDLENTAQVKSFTRRTPIVRSYMRRLVTEQGVTAAKVVDQIKAHRELQARTLQEPDEELRKFYMTCPDPDCNAVITTDETERDLNDQAYRHWFLTQKHQPTLYNELARLIAKDHQGALDCFKEFGLPTSHVVPLPQVNDPMDEGDNEDEEQEDDEVAASHHEQEEAVAVAQDHDQSGSWYIVAPNRVHNGSVMTIRASSREEAVARFIAWKVPELTAASQEVQDQAKEYRVHEELVKQLMVQDEEEPRNIVCHHTECTEMFTEEGITGERGLIRLFEKLALHHMQTHPIEQDTVVARRALAHAAPSFEKAYANML